MKKDADTPLALITRAIPSSGERLPAVGLGSSATFAEVARSADIAALREVLQALVEHGGRVVDTAPSYGASELVAGRIAAAWELPGAVHDALLRDAGTAPGGLPASLRFARAAAAASLLCRHGRIGKAQALAILEQQHGTPPHALQWIWRRLHGRGVETLDTDEAEVDAARSEADVTRIAIVHIPVADQERSSHRTPSLRACSPRR